MATADGLWGYRDRHRETFGRTYFRRCGDGVVASLGLGTRPGAATPAVDTSYRDVVTEALDGGCNVVDTAIDYRHQRSERAIGRALADSDVPRDAVFLMTKGGVVPFDGDRPDDPAAHIRREYVEPGLVEREDFVGPHCIAPAFLDDQLDRSLSNLGVEHIDCYYVQLPEFLLTACPRETVYDELEDAFTLLERRVVASDITHYGVATWDAFRVARDHDRYLSLPAVVSRARAAADRAGRPATAFRAVQLPFNVRMADAFTRAAHDGPDGPQSALAFAADAGLAVFASAALMQGDLCDGLPDDVADRVAGDTPTQRALNFARSAPAVTCALAGTTSVEHVRENVAAGTFDPLGADAFDAVFT
jgi:aryl-alcohol dehydrogenase-like predicted oxidoreductase